MRHFIGALVAVFAFQVVVVANAFATVEEKTCIDKSATIDQKLGCLKGVTFSEITSQPAPRGARLFEIKFEQPTDHDDVKAGTFQQRLVLLHRSETEPMVL